MVDAMVEWFFENYEDPLESVPYDSGEGGYQYYAGGPHEAEDVLREQFDNASEEDIEKAVQRINSCGGPDWVKISDYNFVEDVEDYGQGDYEDDDFDGDNDDELPPETPDSPF